jgi:hypothetical protein
MSWVDEVTMRRRREWQQGSHRDNEVCAELGVQERPVIRHLPALQRQSEGKQTVWIHQQCQTASHSKMNDQVIFFLTNPGLRLVTNLLVAHVLVCES